MTQELIHSTIAFDAPSVRSVDHIFIVGLGRTGSTLTRTILNSSPEVGLGGESHYFRDLPRLGFQNQKGVRQVLRKLGDLGTRQGRKAVLQYIYSPHKKHMNFWNFKSKGVSRQEFEMRLAMTDGSEKSIFDLAMEIHSNGKSIRGEKTPAHIFFVPELLEWYPNARIIHTFRDPRAIFASRRKKAGRDKLPFFNSLLRKLGLIFELLSSLHVMVNWNRVTRLHEKYQKQFPSRYTLLRYEDLITTPEQTLRELCAFLQIEYKETMLQQVVVNSSFVDKGQVVQGFDAGSIERWKTQLDPILKKWFLLWCRRKLQSFGYSL